MTSASTAPAGEPDSLAQEFVQFSVEAGVLRFGEFKTKAGRLSPYFFNTGLFDDGAKLMRLGEFYARRLLASDLAFDMLFGPAYKGITLAAAVAIGLAKNGRNVPFAYNRKEAKDHGEGGLLVGAPVKGRVLIIDDVITDGGSKREAADLIRAVGADPVGVAITMDRQERARDDGDDRRSGVQYVERTLGMRVLAIATLADLMQFLATTNDPRLASNIEKVAAYRARYGIDL
jgi:orotate phosphoribosyltransferase